MVDLKRSADVSKLSSSETDSSINKEGQYFFDTTTNELKFYSSLGLSALTELGNKEWKTISCSGDGSKIVAAVSGGYVYFSSNYGESWTEITEFGARLWYCSDVSLDGNYIIVYVSGSGIFIISSDGGNTWNQKTHTTPLVNWTTVNVSPDGKIMGACTSNGCIVSSSDYGVTWTVAPPSGASKWRGITVISSSLIFFAETGGFIYKSTDLGQTKTALIGGGFRNWFDLCSSIDGTKLAACVFGGYIYTSDDSGVTWTERTGSGSRDWVSIDISTNGEKIIASEILGSIYVSFDGGGTWEEDIYSKNKAWREVTFSSDGSKKIGCALNDYVYIEKANVIKKIG